MGEILGSFLLAVIVMFPLILRLSREEESFKEYSKAEDRCERASEGESIKRLKENMANLEDAYQCSSPYFSSKQKHIHAHNMNVYRESLRLLEEEKWQRKADKYLQNFEECYEIIRSRELEDFRDVELLLKYEKKCIDSWQKYFAIDLTEYESTLYPKRYLKEFMGDDYDPCMESKQALEKKLSEYIDHMRPEYKRKTKLYKILVDYVREVGSIKRAALLKTVFDGYTQDELKCCYRELIKKNRLVEIKLGNLYFVYLSDNEAAKNSESKKKTTAIIGQKRRKQECADDMSGGACLDTMKNDLIPVLDSFRTAKEIYNYLKEYNTANNGVLDPIFMKKIEDYVLIEKLYGNAKDSTMKIVRNFLQREP